MQFVSLTGLFNQPAGTLHRSDHLSWIRLFPAASGPGMEKEWIPSPVPRGSPGLNPPATVLEDRHVGIHYNRYFTRLVSLRPPSGA
ncbi:MAG TPA: hypothetical protein ENO06_02870 [Methanolinea sp.]|nr:hypothetical protein [Methanolinea sp.]